MENVKPTVSIIIPAYQCEKWIRSNIESVIGQTYKNIEIIIINDGSHDETGRICETYAQTDTRIKVVHQMHKGAGAARNIGLEIAQGKYVCFVDADDYIDKTYIEKMVFAILKSQMAVCHRITPDENHMPVITDKKIKICNREDTFRRMLDPRCSPEEACYGYLWNKIFVRKIINEKGIRFKNEYVMWEDMMFCCQYVQYINCASFIPDSLYYYNESNVDSISKKVNIEIMDSWVKAAEAVKKIMKQLKIEKTIGFDILLADLYMKDLIIHVQYKRVSDIHLERIDYLNKNKTLLRKKYRAYLRLYEVSPMFMEKLSMIIRI